MDLAGKLDPESGDHKNAYGISFGIYAATAAYQATGDPKGWKWPSRRPRSRAE